ncbi:MAG: ACP S-malonyltransferase [Micrococcales bacterium]
MLVVVCPGQGSQTPGMLSPWLEIDSFRASIESQQAASGVALIEHGTNSDADTIRDTAIAQPLIVASGVASMATLELAGVAGFAGHSVGEITAAVAAGVFTPEVGIRFVTERANQMAKAAKTVETSMAAVLGGEQSIVEARLAELGLEPANYNGGGQIVAAGAAEAIAALQAEGPAGARVIPLQVAGAFHTRYMAEASDSLADYAKSVEVKDPATKLFTNAGGRIVTSGSEFLALLVNQVKSPVRWDLCMQAMLDAGVTAILEVAPGGTLVGLAKRSMPGIEAVALKSPENLDAARELIKNHSN